MRLLEDRAADLERDNDLLRQGLEIGATTPPLRAPARTVPLAPAYLARALVSVEEHLADLEGFAALGDESAAGRAKVMAVTKTCSTFSRLCDDDRFHNVLMRMQREADEHAASVQQTVTGSANGVAFWELEVQLLELAGLSRLLAEQHVDRAIDAYNADPSGSMLRLQNPMVFLGDLRTLRDATCQSADLLAAGVRRQQSRARWKKILTFGLGGTLIVTANGIGTAFLGPGGVAASGAIGSAAVGAAVPMIA
jgi:hypothetical protein